MANPTTYFGWVMPTATDLVTDLPADFNVFGQGVDTSMQDLLGGTTGQVLSKTSNTNMDFTWVTPTDQTPLTTKGDLFTFTTVDARLGVGTNGQVLTADSTAATGLAWATASSGSTNVAGKNNILNSAMNVSQRGTSFTIASSTATYTLDRWQAYRTATGMTVTQQNTSDTTNLPFIQKCVRLARDSGNTSTVAIQYVQTIETTNSIPYAGKQVTLSFYARAGANYSPTSSALLVYLQTGTGTDQNYINGFTGATNIVSGSTATLTTTWQRFTFTATVGATATQLAVALNMNPTGTAGANDYCEVTGFQLEAAASASAYSPNTATYALELAACQRYYEQTFASAATESANKVSAYSDANYTQGTRWKVTKRVAPTVVVYSTNGGTANRIRQISSNVNYTPAGTADIGIDGFNIFTGIGQSNMMDFHYTASAEL